MLSDKEIMLRALEHSDVEVLYEWENMSELWHTSATLAPYSRHNLLRYIENYDANPFSSGELRMMAHLKADNKAVGFVDLYGVEVRHRRAFIGILISPAYQHRGYGKRVLRLLEKYAAEHLQLHQLLAVVPEYNTGSCALFSGAGFSSISVLPDFIAIGNNFHDALLYHKML